MLMAVLRSLELELEAVWEMAISKFASGARKNESMWAIVSGVLNVAPMRVCPRPLKVRFRDIEIGVNDGSSKVGFARAIFAKCSSSAVGSIGCLSPGPENDIFVCVELT